jgi:hypothetical protein
MALSENMHSAPKDPPDVSLSPPSMEMNTDRDAVHGAKNQVVNRPEMDNSTTTPPKPLPTPSLKTFSFEFVVDNCARDGAANGARLLHELVCALTKQDKYSSVLLSNSTSENQSINGYTIFPIASIKLKAFVLRYIGGLRFTAKSSLKGKITVRSSFTFQALCKSTEVKSFLTGTVLGTQSNRLRSV